MNTVVGKFEKVSKEEYFRFINTSGFTFDKFVDYDDIKLPTRATKGSAGYDFYSGMSYDYIQDSNFRNCYKDNQGLTGYHMDSERLFFCHGNHILVPTFIKCNMNFTPVYNDSNWVLILAPKSGIASKTGIRLSNTIGIIDSDYYNNENNEGHILLDITYESIIYGKNSGDRDIIGAPTLVVEKNQKLVQGFFVPFGIAENDNETEFTERAGGFGSTGLN